jgi:hypothetical protein
MGVSFLYLPIFVLSFYLLHQFKFPSTIILFLHSKKLFVQPCLHFVSCLREILSALSSCLENLSQAISPFWGGGQFDSVLYLHQSILRYAHKYMQTQIGPILGACCPRSYVGIIRERPVY